MNNAARKLVKFLKDILFSEQKKIFLFIIITSVTISFINDNWIFTPKGYLDPWLYVGYGLTFDDYKFGGYLKTTYYKLSRIPWVYFQYLVRKIFSPAGSSYVISYLCLWACAFSVYLTIKKLLGHISGLVAAIFLCIYYPFLGSGGADYHNTLAGPLYALSFLVLTIAAQSKNNTKNWLILFGFIYALTIHTMILYVNFTPVFLIHFYTTRKLLGNSIKNVLRFQYLISVAIGGFIATIMCGTISWIYNYNFLFFMPQFKLTKTFLVGEWSKSPWWKPFSFEWLNQAFWLAPLTAMLIISVAIIVFKMKKIVAIKKINQEQSLLIQFVCISLIWLFWHFMRKDTLNTSYFAYPLIIPFIYSLTSFLNSRLCKYTNNNIFAYILALTSFVLYSVPVFFKNNFHFKSLFAFEAIIFLLFIILFVKLRKSIFISASILSCVGVAPFYFQGYSKSHRDSYVAITEASKWIYETYGNRNIKKNRAKKVFLWFNEDSNLKSENSKFLTDMGYSLTNTSFDYLNQPFPMPSIDNLNRDEINQKFFNLKKHVIILVTESIDEVKKMQSKLLEFGYDLSYLEYHQIKVNNVSLPLYVLRD